MLLFHRQKQARHEPRRLRGRQRLVPWPSVLQVLLEGAVALTAFSIGGYWAYSQLESSCVNCSSDENRKPKEITESFSTQEAFGIPFQFSPYLNIVSESSDGSHGQTKSLSKECQQTIFLNTQDKTTCHAIVPLNSSKNFVPPNHHPDLLLAKSRSRRTADGFDAVSWYDDHGHKPSWRLSSPPKPVLIHESWWPLLSRYLMVYDGALEALRKLLLQRGPQKSWTIMATNAHHVDFLRNIDCASRRISMDRSNILVVALDKEAFHVAKHDLGLLTFYYEPLVDVLSETNTTEYANRAYGAVMLVAKVHVVHLFSQLKSYDFLFQDVDVVPLRKDYADYMKKKLKEEEGDMLFQYDYFTPQQTHPEYGPWYVNSGFFYVINNDRTRNFLSSLLRNGDLVLRSNSHQAVLSWLLSRHVSRNQLRVRVLSNDAEADLFPGGFHFHHKWNYMRRMLISKEKNPYIFHMNYNDRKETKISFFQQMGLWFVDYSDRTCSQCCNLDPVPICHYSDKPSAVACSQYPAVETGEPFW
uniref:Nucleotide-diphospho-sugar transferase domain-containing protein n=1 Tax=Entomoneis paludosa TaxID=265537 RepID=A0A6U3CCG1_9STRA|mmetsp:Transcript_36186/g.75254  ORF Transcript_36186/g.75254 Transcript_36186/m.75254 type:complete len:528 (+) Transcript_36186:191-1774(+)|eukprot:CAMPEP_0172455068 /NCGR_PEP_ID=MMETSP1065-20121228/11867_1 /TAXON_ID=265537 /ORGANISM="Amphiprora paludosa, Strain CCMP125" /LENGTH=527 /DNA_ID=CAMNT_0013207519 /DNA_START=130 /DNA_END=1713 /DNA_ORIENTATION=+